MIVRITLLCILSEFGELADSASLQNCLGGGSVDKGPTAVCSVFDAQARCWTNATRHLRYRRAANKLVVLSCLLDTSAAASARRLRC